MKKGNYFWISLVLTLIVLGTVYIIGKKDGKEHKKFETRDLIKKGSK